MLLTYKPLSNIVEANITRETGGVQPFPPKTVPSHAEGLPVGSLSTENQYSRAHSLVFYTTAVVEVLNCHTSRDSLWAT